MNNLALVDVKCWLPTATSNYVNQIRGSSFTQIWVTRQWAKTAVHDDVIKWKNFPRYWPFVQGIRRSPVNFSHKDQWREALMLSLICVWMSGWVKNGEAGDLRRHCTHYDVTVMRKWLPLTLDINKVVIILWSINNEISCLQAICLRRNYSKVWYILIITFQPPS